MDVLSLVGCPGEDTRTANLDESAFVRLHPGLGRHIEFERVATFGLDKNTSGIGTVDDADDAG